MRPIWSWLGKLVPRERKDGNQHGDSPKPVSLRNVKYPLFMWPKSQDADVAIYNVTREKYGCFERGKNPEWVINAGAVIGDAIAHVLSKYPRRGVFALKLNPSNREIASLTAAPDTTSKFSRDPQGSAFAERAPLRVATKRKYAWPAPKPQIVLRLRDLVNSTARLLVDVDLANYCGKAFVYVICKIQYATNEF